MMRKNHTRLSWRRAGGPFFCRGLLLTGQTGLPIVPAMNGLYSMIGICREIIS
jgi:hypothetical protein